MQEVNIVCTYVRVHVQFYIQNVLSSLRQFYCFSWVTICFKQSFLFQYKRQVIDLHSSTPVLCCFPRQKTSIWTSAAIYIYSIEPIKTNFFLRYTCSCTVYSTKLWPHFLFCGHIVLYLLNIIP
jgi:hypothetical protein